MPIARPTDKWFVVYEVEGFGKQKAGPWPILVAEEQARDIAGFEGVSGLRLEVEIPSEE
jgi:hypothetical protein